MEQVLAAALRVAVEQWKRTATLEERRAECTQPATLGGKLGAAVELALLSASIVPSAVRTWALAAPFFHLQRVFNPTEEVETPVAFCPVPDTAATVEARAVALAVHAFLRLETVSYGTENGGELFVNLVGMAGSGRFAEKSKRSMRGHTDGVSFPLNGDADTNNPRIAPSPDVVTLVGMRNPHDVATTVMVLKEVLDKLSPEDVLELKRRQFSMNSQMTFVQGMKALMRNPLVANGQAVLKDVDGDTVVRYSHTNVVPTDDDAARAQQASDNFEASCNAVVRSQVIKPGDILVVSNRLGLHGRGVPGDEVGGLSRWLIRTYGLDTSALTTEQRHLGDRPAHVLYP